MAPKTRRTKTVKPKVTAWGKLGLQPTAHRFVVVAAIVLFAAIGSYFLVASHAQDVSNSHAEHLRERPDRGVSYKNEKVETAGPCAGMVLVEQAAEKAANKAQCAHADPGPEGVDVRERDKTVDQELLAQAEIDKTHPAKASDDTTGDDQINATEGGGADVGSANSLNAVAARNWPCIGTGADGNRIQVIYAYASGNSNRINYLRPGFETLFRRVNATFYNSGVDSGAAKQIRYVTNSSCVLSIPAIPITGDLNSFSNIKNQLSAKGYNLSNRKYVVEVDGGSNCGYGSNWADDTAGATNYNNRATAYAVVWHPCWNYGEPHEIMHTLGAVQLSAPHHTKYYHCYDQHDIMCYNDGSGIAMKQICTNSVYIWRFDCRHDDYYSSKPASGSYLATHWNIATSSKILYPNAQ